MLEGAIEPKAIAKQAQRLGFPGVALTDRNGLYARDAVQRRLHRGGRAADHRHDARRRRPGRHRPARRRSTGWCCWPRTRRATPISASWSRRRISTGRSRRSRMSRFDALDGRTDGLIALTGGRRGRARPADRRRPGRQGRGLCRPAAGAVPGPALRRAQPPRRSGRGGRRGALIELAYARDLPLVATNPAAYAEPSFHAAHDAMLCIAHSSLCRKRRPRHAPRPKPG